VNDMAYFVTLLRYIHQNPVKAGMVSEAKDL
jgi:REP element-mobilizing transposase RayT